MTNYRNWEQIINLTNAIEEGGANADTYHQRGMAYHKKGLYQAAINDYDQALLASPDKQSCRASRERAAARLDMQ